MNDISPSIIITAEMFRDDVILWGTVILIIFFAFVLMPAHEYFKDAQGREVDVDPNAPPMPEALKPINERTGKREGFDNPPLSGVTAIPSATLPQFSTTSTLGTATGITGMEPILTQGDLQDAKIRFIKLLIGNETDQSVKVALNEKVLDLQKISKGSPQSVSNRPLGSAEEIEYKILTSAPPNYTYSQFSSDLAVSTSTPAGKLVVNPGNIDKYLDFLSSGKFKFNSPSPQPRPTNVSQISDMGGLYGPGPYVARSALQSCSCASQSPGCPIHSG